MATRNHLKKVIFLCLFIALSPLFRGQTKKGRVTESKTSAKKIDSDASKTKKTSTTDADKTTASKPVSSRGAQTQKKDLSFQEVLDALLKTVQSIRNKSQEESKLNLVIATQITNEFLCLNVNKQKKVNISFENMDNPIVAFKTKKGKIKIVFNGKDFLTQGIKQEMFDIFKKAVEQYPTDPDSAKLRALSQNVEEFLMFLESFLNNLI
jgi:hypothetical protein